MSSLVQFESFADFQGFLEGYPGPIETIRIAGPVQTLRGLFVRDEGPLSEEDISKLERFETGHGLNPITIEYETSQIELFEKSKETIKNAASDAYQKIGKEVRISSFMGQQHHLLAGIESSKESFIDLEAIIRETVGALFEDEDFFKSGRLFDYVSKQLLNEDSQSILDSAIDTAFVAMFLYSKSEKNVTQSNLERLCLSGVLSDISQILFPRKYGSDVVDHPEMSYSICKKLGIEEKVLEPIRYHHLIQEEGLIGQSSPLGINTSYLILANAYVQAYRFYQGKEASFKFLKYLSLKGYLNKEVLERTIMKNLGFDSSSKLTRLYLRYVNAGCTNGIPKSLITGNKADYNEPFICGENGCKSIDRGLNSTLTKDFSSLFVPIGLEPLFKEGKTYGGCVELN